MFYEHILRMSASHTHAGSNTSQVHQGDRLVRQEAVIFRRTSLLKQGKMNTTALGKCVVLLFIIFTILFSVVDGSGVTDREASQCSMRDAHTCHQYASIRRQNLTCQVSKKFTNCDQLCHAAKCNMSCTAPDDCRQRCYAGACELLECTSMKCRQHCLRSKCNLKCNSEECIQESNVAGSIMTCKPGTKRCMQTCKAGKCIMNCPLGVKYCKQTCIYGNCIMHCKAQKCARSCREGKCIYDSKPQRPRTKVSIINKCNYGYVNKTCYQECIPGNCDVISNDLRTNNSQICFGGHCNLDCTDKQKCTQVCIGEGCPKLTCTAGVCLQECVSGGCEMECVSADICSQICRGGNCSMKCLNTHTKTCQQYCTGGNCNMQCNAERCIPSCYAGNCNYKRIRPPGSDRNALCDVVKNGVCHQNCISYEGCNMVYNQQDNMHSCNQSCHAGYCNLNCSSKDTCTQNCAGGNCESMLCNAKTCKQVCNRGVCGTIKCNAERCIQLCFGANCHMTCPSHVKDCHQGCMTRQGPCIFDCHARNCTLTLA